MATGRGFSLHTLSLTSTALLSLLVVALAGGLMWTSRLVWQSAQITERDTQAIILTSEFDRVLREHQRLANQSVAIGNPDVEARSESESKLRRMLVETQDYVGDAVEARLLGQLSDDLGAYFSEREAVEARGLSLDQIVQMVRPSFERALASSARLRGHNEINLKQTQREAEQVLRFERLLAISSTVLLLVGLASIVLGVRWLVLRPVFDLQEAMRRFRSGDAEAKAREGPTTEVRELASTFNEMADRITHQRREQLTFLAGVAHDLQNPLWALKMSIYALERDPEATTAERFRRLDRQIDRLTRMVGDLLDATRIEAGQLEVQLEDMDLREAARAIVDLYAPTTTTHEVVLRAPDRPIIVRGDPLRVEQVISNLLSNAIKYSPAGGPVVVSIAADDKEAALAVSDRGLGIPPEDLPSIFMPFRRRGATAEIAPGVGLGLSIVRRIVDAHGGRIEVESTPATGSTFQVCLPLAAVTERDL
jgi:two-component system, OmpR family, sensor histidine kinase MtrB